MVLNYMNRMNTAQAIQQAMQGVAQEQVDYLASVEALLDSTLRAEGADPARGDTLMNAARHLCLGGGGKRARPMLAKLFAEAVDAPTEHVVTIGVAAELIHSASLLHDDVVDAGMFRRGRPTVNARWGNIVAVMSGDMILSSALEMLTPVDPLIVADAIKLVQEMTRAAIAEVEARADLSLPLDRLRFIHEGKTGSLFGFCGMAAARLAGNLEAGRRFEAFGRRLGVAFQIADDVRDLTGTDEGKPQYADVQSKTPSLPILLAVSKDDGLRRKLKESWAFTLNPERVKELGELIQASGALELAVEKLNTEIEAGIDALGPYGQSAGGSALVGWARKLAEGVAARKAGG